MTVAAMLCDAWPPSFFWRPDAQGPGGGQAMATVDFAIHFRSTLPLPNAKPGDWTLLQFWSRHAHEGFVEEDGELWSQDGTLIAHSRQLAVLL